MYYNHTVGQILLCSSRHSAHKETKLLLMIPGKVSTDKPTDTYRKRLELTQLAKRLSCYAALLLRKQPKHEKCFPIRGWPLYKPMVVPLWVQPFWSCGEHKCTQSACAPWAAVPLHQALHHQFKPCQFPYKLELACQFWSRSFLTHLFSRGLTELV